mmetsp:Transcript_9010/g.20323  ORF Transcript_9010/g.20323 Transcript_9010/m.20323 type:complete len:295 (-) Transcript_9010:58-942(-)
MRQNGIRRKHGTLALNRQLFNNGIIRRSHRIKLLRLHPLQWSRSPRRHLIILIVILIQKSTPFQILHALGCRIVQEAGEGGGALGELAEVNVLDATPVGADGDGCLAIDAVAPASSAEAASATAAATTSSAAAVAGPPRPLWLTVPPHISTLLTIIPPRIQLPQPHGIRPSPSLRYKPLATSPTRRSTRTTSRTIRLARIHQLKLLRLLGIHLVLKFQIFIRIRLVVVATASIAKVSSGGIAGAGEGLGGEIGAAAETIGSAEGCVGQLGEAGLRSRFGLFAAVIAAAEGGRTP